MVKKSNGPRIVAIDAEGGSQRIKAERLELDFGRGCKLVLDFPHMAWGDIDIEAVAGEGTPIITVQAGACNLITVRTDVHHEMVPMELGELPAPARVPQLSLNVQKALNDADRALSPKKHRLRRWAQAAARRDAELTIRLVGEEEGRQLNHDFRGKDAATNVLTFIYGEGEALPQMASAQQADAPLAGDLVLCVPVVAREAAAQGKALDAHYAHLVVHGMLHLQGFDHENDAEAAVMEALEKEILAGLGYPDPYA